MKAGLTRLRFALTVAAFTLRILLTKRPRRRSVRWGHWEYTSIRFHSVNHRTVIGGGRVYCCRLLPSVAV
jgi:hypothetical protein